MFSIGSSAVTAGQIGLWVVTSNLHNVATPSYARRQVQFVTTLDGGVRATVRRMADSDALGLYWRRMGSLGVAEGAEGNLKQLEGLFGAEPPMGQASPLPGSTGLGMRWLFDRLIYAGGEATGTEGRQGVLAAAKALAENFSRLDNGLADLLTSAEGQWRGTVDKINDASAGLADLNAKIAAARAAGQDEQAFVLLDQRDALVATLHGLTGAEVVPRSDDTIDLVLPGGASLVSGQTAARLAIDAAGEGKLTLQLGKASLSLAERDLGGQLKGVVDSERIVSAQREHMRAFAKTFVERFNAQLAKGFDSNGKPGKPLFTYDETTGRMSVDPTLGVSDLAFASSAAGGDGGNLLELQKLADAEIEVPGLGKHKLADVYGAIRGEIASAHSANAAALDRARADVLAARAAVDEISGVSAEEEQEMYVELGKWIAANNKAMLIARDLFADLIRDI
ncbi:flagellar hook-associated protein FlgK [Chitinasiproducens palmae]|uniref:Flagellar hook-associated protein 1 n=1 Tax=Chitinasiproducens palmae TaxID=1770053 RepID=A0A1H2PKH7_9BURK|nr:hypothetical protein [Chitinasiproducens palmae]SDV46957.1 flagellar hook-associated protein 1 FlgK [Chitinasiproducens palmae]